MQCRRLLLLGVLFFSLALASACGDRQASVPPRSQAGPTPTATIKDLMDSLIDPSADVVWESVSTEVTATGTVDKVPHTDQDWKNVRRGAIRLVEGANLLMIPGRHVARSGEKSEAPGAELEPDEMEALINKDLDGWNTRARGLFEASLVMLKAADAKSPEAVLDASDRLEMACETCHVQDRYPNQKLPPGYAEGSLRK